MADRFLTMARADRWLFPAAALWAALCVPLWLAGGMPAAPAWHGHALLFGFAPAVIGG
ncbi:MAG: NnrS family protein, partial [Gammaproteobacteria bacterium]